MVNEWKWKTLDPPTLLPWNSDPIVLLKLIVKFEIQIFNCSSCFRKIMIFCPWCLKTSYKLNLNSYVKASTSGNILTVAVEKQQQFQKLYTYFCNLLHLLSSDLIWLRLTNHKKSHSSMLPSVRYFYDDEEHHVIVATGSTTPLKDRL